MATLDTIRPTQDYRVIHPLDDIAETKRSTTGLGPMRMTVAARLSLTLLRAYLVLITLMLAYHVLDLAGWLRLVR